MSENQYIVIQLRGDAPALPGVIVYATSIYLAVTNFKRYGWCKTFSLVHNFLEICLLSVEVPM